MRLIARLFAYCERFSIASENLGFLNAVQVFMSIRRGAALQSIRVPRLGRTIHIHYRGRADRGAISHFFYKGTRIIATPEHPIRTIVDAGANIGIESIRMLHFYPHARVLAIEPDAGNYAVLARNSEQYIDRMQTLRKGVWSTNSALRVIPGSTNEGFSVRPALPGESIDVEAISMNAILDRVGGEIDLLKMDIEGSEFEVFLKNTEWVRRVKAIVFECPDNDYAGATQQIFRTMDFTGFVTAVSGENIVLLKQDTGWRLEDTAYL